jgi:trigger factor
VKSTLEPLEGNKVKLSVEVDEVEFDKDIDAAFRKLAQEIRLPGFRPGKAPRRVLEARIGVGPAREQALRDGIPNYLAKAVREHDVDLIATPEIELTGGAESGQVQFDATCEVRPTVSVPGYGGLRVELPRPEATDDEVQEVVDSERRRHGSLAAVERPAALGDFVTLDMAATRGDDSEPVPGLNVDDFLYELGRGWVGEGFDDEIVGATPGDDLSFTLPLSGTGEPADFEITVTQVQELVLPDVTDDWVSEHLGEFDTVEAWHASIRERIATVKLGQARRLLLDRTSAALAELVDDEPPEVLVEQETRSRVENFVRDINSRGISIEQWVSATGQDPNAIMANIGEQARRAVVVDLALRAVADAEQMEVTAADIEAEYARVAMRTGMKAKDVRKAYERNDAVWELSAQLRTSKAMDWLLHHVEIVDETGQPIDRDLLLGHDHDDDHDHDDHDHDGHDHDGHDHQHDHDAEEA